MAVHYTLHIVTDAHIQLSDKNMTQEDFDAVFEKSWAQYYASLLPLQHTDQVPCLCRWDKDDSGFVEISEFKQIADDVAIADNESRKKFWATYCKENPKEVTKEDQKRHDEMLNQALTSFKVQRQTLCCFCGGTAHLMRVYRAPRLRRCSRKSTLKEGIRTAN